MALDRRGFNAALLAASLGCAAPGVRAQRQAHRLGMLGVGSASMFFGGDRRKILDSLAALGYVVGRNLALEERFEPKSPEELARFATQLAAIPVDAILTEGTPATLAAQQATRTVPIVTTVADFVVAGFARDLRRPGGNITGMSQNRSAMAGKQVELLRELRPGLATVAILHKEPYPGAELLYRAFAQAAHEQSIATPVMSYRRGEAGSRLDEVKRLQVDTVLHMGERDVLQAAVARGIAVMAASSEDVAAGALVSIDSDTAENYRRLAELLDRVFRGASPAEIPIEGPARYQVTINAKTAAALGIRLAPAMRLRADRLIE